MRYPTPGGTTALPSTIDPRPARRGAARGVPEPRLAARESARRLLLLALLGTPIAAGALLPRIAHAQGLRSFPESARPGRFEMRVFPEALLNGEPVRLGAGARIHDASNRIVMPATLSGSHDVLVERDPSGQIGRVWILTPEESSAARQRERR